MFGPKSGKCVGCQNRTTALYGIPVQRVCPSCRSKIKATRKRIERDGLIVDTAGGLWWIWDAKGTVLVLGKPTRQDAVWSLAFDGEHEDETPTVST